MAEMKEVTVKLTDEQQRQIKNATGQDITEVKVSADRGNRWRRRRFQRVLTRLWQSWQIGPTHLRCLRTGPTRLRDLLTGPTQVRRLPTGPTQVRHLPTGPTRVH